MSTKVSVTVSVLDVNEFPPELAVPSDTFVCENSRVGQVNWTNDCKDINSGICSILHRWYYPML